MISKRYSKYVFFGTFVMAMLIPAVAFAQEGGPVAAATMADATKSLAAALAMAVSAIAAGWAQARIGSAGQGTLAERPEERVFVLTLTALPEVIALLGFVMAIIING